MNSNKVIVSVHLKIKTKDRLRICLSSQGSDTTHAFVQLSWTEARYQSFTSYLGNVQWRFELVINSLRNSWIDRIFKMPVPSCLSCNYKSSYWYACEPCLAKIIRADFRYTVSLIISFSILSICFFHVFCCYAPNLLICVI